MRKIESPSGIFPVKLIPRTLDIITSNVTGMKIKSKLGHVTVFKSKRKKGNTFLFFHYTQFSATTSHHRGK